MRGPLRVVRAEARPGRKALRRLIGRADAVLDERTVAQAGKLVERVRRRGDRALLEAVRAFDGLDADSVADLSLGVWSDAGATDAGATASEPAAEEDLPDGFEEALEQSIAAVERYHAPQVHSGYRLEETGVVLEERRTPLSRVGIYVPGGRASYPSTVVMAAVPARLAGVSEIVVATPPATLFAATPAGAALRHTLRRLAVDEVWGMGGAHAVAALAYGTETIRRVDKIVGPGNAWVTAAKSLVAGAVAIDGVAGPSEVVIVVDGTDGGGRAAYRAERVAADLLAQAEHDPRAAAVLITDSASLAKEVARQVAAALPELATAATARKALATFGAAFVVSSIEEAVPLIEAIAPEHLQLVGPAAEALADRPLPAGAIFVGADTPEVFGDYVAGPSHVLPTCGTARFASALGVEDFVRRSHLIRTTSAAARRMAPAAAALADAEGLPAHARAARLRAPAPASVPPAAGSTPQEPPSEDGEDAP